MSSDKRTAIERKTPALAARTLGRADVAADASADAGADADPLPAGTLLAGRYRVLARLGTGGMGAVYRARDTTLDADVALKLLHGVSAADPDRLALFRAEVRVARLVTHPNVCRLHDLEDSPDGCFITMEHVDGESLAARLRGGAITLAAARAILRDVAAGLAAAHAAGVVHRDLKPSNVLLARDGRAIVADFGIAAEHRELAAGAPQIAGTLGYMAPEQARGGQVDARADVYAFGVLALVATTGARPLPNLTSTTETPMDGGSAAALPVADIAPLLAPLPAALAQLIARCLADDPADRPADGAALVAALAADAEPDPPPPPPPRHRTRWLAALAIPVAALALGLALRSHAPHAAPRVFVAPSDASALPAADRWLAPVVDRLVANELVDGWGLDAELGAPADAAGAVVIRARLAIDPTGRLALALGDRTLEAATPRALALEAGAAIARAEVPDDLRRPTAAELRAVSAHDPEAWRQWRRAQRESMMQRWERVEALCADAIARDPAFPLPRLEAAMVFDNDDPAGVAAVAAALAEVDRAEVPPVWHLASRLLRQVAAGDQAGAARTVADMHALPLEPRDRLYLDVRLAISAFASDARTAAPTVALLAEQNPRDGAASKLAAAIYLDSDEPGADVIALRYAEEAVARAPDDAGARADLGIALVRAGRVDDARARAAELAAMPPDERRLARSRLFELHMALGEPAEAEADARREQSGSPTERAGGLAEAGLVRLYWGELAAGLDGLAAGADAFDAAGLARSAAQQRYRLAMAAWQLGDLPRARDAFARIATGHSPFAAGSGALAKLVDGDLAGAHALAGKLAAGSVARLLVDVKLAAAEHRAADVLATSDQLAAASTTTEVLLDRADALARLGRRDAAIAELTRFVHHPLAYTQPVAAMLAWSRLGELRLAAHDEAGARVAFAEVARRWERASLRPEVVRARRMIAGP